ncbi:MAG TPA: hypothetical protein V6D22_21465 [Candidatus Obscuribacterales bacterium]
MFTSLFAALALLSGSAAPGFCEDFSTHNRYHFVPHYYRLEQAKLPPELFTVRSGSVNAPKIVVDDVLLPDEPPPVPRQSDFQPAFGFPSPPQAASPLPPVASTVPVTAMPAPTMLMSAPTQHIIHYIRSTHAHLAAVNAPPTVSAPARSKHSIATAASYPRNTGFSFYWPTTSAAGSSASTQVSAKLLPSSSGR